MESTGKSNCEVCIKFVFKTTLWFHLLRLSIFCKFYSICEWIVKNKPLMIAYILEHGKLKKSFEVVCPEIKLG